jgi:hypothetical protein
MICACLADPLFLMLRIPVAVHTFVRRSGSECRFVRAGHLPGQDVTEPARDALALGHQVRWLALSWCLEPCTL